VSIEDAVDREGWRALVEAAKRHEAKKKVFIDSGYILNFK